MSESLRDTISAAVESITGNDAPAETTDTTAAEYETWHDQKPSHAPRPNEIVAADKRAAGGVVVHPDGKRVLFFASTHPAAHVGSVVILDRATGKETVLAENVHTEDAHRAEVE